MPEALNRRPPPLPLDRGSPFDLIIGELATGLVAATNSWTGASVAIGYVYEPYTNTAQVPRLLEYKYSVDLVNRSMNFSGPAGAMFIAAYINSEWVVVWVDCDASPGGYY